MQPRKRIIQLFMRILNNPRLYSRPELAKYFNTSQKVINEDTDIINSIPEINLCYQKHPYKCYIEPNNKYSALQKFTPLNEEDKYHLQRLLNGMGNLSLAEQLRTKIEGLYDFQQLGFRQLRHPAIERINRLEGAKQQKKQVILKNYRSNNSNKIKDRVVEPFLINPELDTLQALNVDDRIAKHFRLSRIERVEITSQDWQFETKHQPKLTDIFRIANNQQIQVTLRLQVRAYNMLIESFPLAKNYLDPDSKENHFIFQAPVNEDFFGLLPFILSNSHFIEVLSPERLKVNIRQAAQQILDKF